MHIANTELVFYALLASPRGRVQGDCAICFSQRSQEQGAYPSFALLLLHSSFIFTVVDSFEHVFSLHVHFFINCWVNCFFFIAILNWVINITGNGQAWWLVVSVLHAGGVLGWSAALEEDQGQGVCYTEMREQVLLIWRQLIIMHVFAH